MAILLLLVTGHMGQTIVALSLDGLEIDKSEAMFELKTLLKLNRTGDPLSLSINVFQKDWKLCVLPAFGPSETRLDRYVGMMDHMHA